MHGGFTPALPHALFNQSQIVIISSFRLDREALMSLQRSLSILLSIFVLAIGAGIARTGCEHHRSAGLRCLSLSERRFELRKWRLTRSQKTAQTKISQTRG
jgi:hypothetical protein